MITKASVIKGLVIAGATAVVVTISIIMFSLESTKLEPMVFGKTELVYIA